MGIICRIQPETHTNICGTVCIVLFRTFVLNSCKHSTFFPQMNNQTSHGSSELFLSKSSFKFCSLLHGQCNPMQSYTLLTSLKSVPWIHQCASRSTQCSPPYTHVYPESGCIKSCTRKNVNGNAISLTWHKWLLQTFSCISTWARGVAQVEIVSWIQPNWLRRVELCSVRSLVSKFKSERRSTR